MNSNKAKKLTALMLAAITVSSIGLENIAPMGINTCEAVVRKTVRKRIVATKPSAEETPTQTESSPDIVNSSSAGGVTGEISPSGSNSRSSQTVTQGGKLVAAASSGLISAKTGSSIIKPVTRNPVNSGAAVTKPLLGDVNGDGKVSLTDLSLLKGFIAGTISEDRIVKTNADLNGDGKISTTDLSLLKTAVMGRDEAKQDENKVLGENIEEGLYSLRPACAPNLELTVENASMEKGANVFLWDINSNWHTQPSHQKWRISRVEGNWYKIEAENSGLALNIHNGISANGTNVTIWPYSGNMHEFRFFNAGDGYYYIQGNIAGKYVLDVENFGNTPGTNVSMHDFNGSTAQKWKLVNVQGAVEAAEEVAQRYVDVYNDAALTNKSANRWISKGETYRVLQDCGTSFKVSYYSSSGQPREGYVNKNIREIKVINGALYELKDNWVETSWEPYGKKDGSGQEWPNEEKAVGGQCFGFANYIFCELHGTICGRTIGNSYIVSNRPEGVKQYGLLSSTTQDDLESIFKDQATPGDFIQGNKNGASPHSMIFMEYDSANKTIWVLDANSDNKNTIKYRSITLDDFVQRFTSVSFYTT